MAEVMDEDDYDEDCVRMFRELARNFRHTVVDDYCKNGRWLREHLEIDLELVLAHRRHAGAGEPRPLEEIPIPRLPTPRRLPLPPAPPPPAATEIGEGRLATRSARLLQLLLATGLTWPHFRGTCLPDQREADLRRIAPRQQP